jgi:hypothetical protein
LARASQPQSRAELARHRNRRRRFRHSFSEHERPNLDLGDERKPPGRRRRGQRQWRPELEGNQVNLTRCSFSACASIRRERERSRGPCFRTAQRPTKAAAKRLASPVPLKAHVGQLSQQRREHCARARGARCRTGHMPSLAKACPARYTEIQRKLSTCHLPKQLLAKRTERTWVMSRRESSG